MNKRLVTVLLFALVVSSAASFLVYQLVSKQLASNTKGPTSVLVVATRTLETGALIKEGDLKLAEFTGTPPEGSFSRMEDIVGRGVVQPVVGGESVLESRIAPRGAGAGLAAIIPPGMRAVAIRVNDVVGVAGFVTPGMRVDILIAGTPPGGSAAVGTLSRTLFQNIEVLSAGQNIQKDAEGKPVNVQVVNLLVTPDQAEVLSLASNETRIQLVLRNPTDKEVAKTPGTATAYLYTGGSPPPAAAPKAPAPARQPAAPKKVEPPPPPPPPAPAPEKVVPPPITVEVIHGSRKVESKFQAEEKN